MVDDLRRDVFVVALEGYSESRTLDSLPKSVLTAASRAINRTADRTRTRAADEILKQVSLPRSYLNPSQQRLYVRKKASPDNLEAVITARMRPTMLARYAPLAAKPGVQGVTVQVAPGLAKFMKRAFIINLPAGRSTENGINRGLAIRLRAGEVVRNKKVMQKLSGQGNLYIMYGPSIDQVFQSVREDVSPDAQEFLATEFSRLLELEL